MFLDDCVCVVASKTELVQQIEDMTAMKDELSSEVRESLLIDCVLSSLILLD